MQNALQDMQNQRNALVERRRRGHEEGRQRPRRGHQGRSRGAERCHRQGEEDERQLDAKLNDTLAAIPNIPLDEVPDGTDEHGNVEVRRWGSPPGHNFEPRQHFDVGETLKMMDFETAAKISGARFVVTKGQLARLERALAQFMLDTQTEKNGYTEHYVPLLVNDKTMFGTAQLPKFVDDQFRTTDGRWLIPTAEVSLTNLVRESDSRRSTTAAAPHRLHAMFPRRSRSGGPRYARHDPPAPVLQSRTRLDHHAGTIPRRTGAHDRLRRKHPASAWACITASCACAPATWALAPHDL